MAFSDIPPPETDEFVSNPERLRTAYQRSRPPGKHRWIWIVLFVIICVVAVIFYRSRASSASLAASKRTQGSLSTIPVGVSPVEKKDVPYYLTGLGTVTPHNTVTAKSRVDGQLEKVFFREGQFVKEGELLAQIDPRPFQVALDQAQGQLAKDQAQLNDAQVNLARYQELAKEGVVSVQQAETQKATVGQLEGAIRSDQAVINNQKLQLIYTRITAPISGRAGLRLVDQGNMVRASDPNGLVVITQVYPIDVLFTLPEDNLPTVVQQMRKGNLSVDAYSRDDLTKLATGKLTTIDNQIDQTTGTVRFKAVFENTDSSLWPNQFVNVKLLLTVRNDALVIPAAAILRGTQGPYVYVAKDNQAEVRPIAVDVTQGNSAVISSGLQEGEQVIVDGQDKIQAGSKVNVRPSSPATSGKPQAGDGGALSPSGGTRQRTPQNSGNR
ncbi:MAG TPA: MdtA/MuxA family multidrug efflux RND transporter periplasmic adaptor subunit [Candidatus Dormibacteraeota bacterium]|nr:MdtA/MuxA family multidrug efflux RND transporter periplasmic adaptor subunit [Candidatus Dormibacteraeota bacterium]